MENAVKNRWSNSSVIEVTLTSVRVYTRQTLLFFSIIVSLKWVSYLNSSPEKLDDGRISGAALPKSSCICSQVRLESTHRSQIRPSLSRVSVSNAAVLKEWFREEACLKGLNDILDRISQFTRIHYRLYHCRINLSCPFFSTCWGIYQQFSQTFVTQSIIYQCQIPAQPDLFFLAARHV